jgi:heterodisulfide reductase subunit C
MSLSFASLGLRTALLLALLGTAWRVASWLRLYVGPAGARPRARERLGAAITGALAGLFGRRAPGVAVAFLLDLLLQRRLLRADAVRWAAHLSVFLGFMGLLLLHALGDTVAARLFGGYTSTLNPWLALRDVLGLAILVGLAVGAARRRGHARPRRRDPAFVGLLVAVVASGFLLAAAKIVSEPAFERMAKEYPVAAGEELDSLRRYWAEELGVALARPGTRSTAAALAAGKDLHEQGCEGCHSRPTAAIVSYPLSRGLVPVAGALAAHDAERWLLGLHLLFCFLGLAYLPFGRFFHVVADPVSLVARAGSRRETPGAPESPGPNAATHRAIALDACVRCGLCDARCSVGPLAGHLENRSVLPSEKILVARLLSSGSGSTATELSRIAEGAHACTDCGRCTRVCPVGLDLVDLWAATRDALAERGRPITPVRFKAVPATTWAERLAASPPVAEPRGEDGHPALLTGDRRTFAPCVQCQTCTNVCPVVACSMGDEHGVDATPQKVMNLLRLGLLDLALGTRMVWDCATCYQCQEHCPAGIRVTDVLYELRQRAHARLARLDAAAGRKPA